MISITPSHIIQHLYCPRYTYFEWVLRIPQNEEKYGKVMRGRKIHDQRLERNKGYLRKRLGVTNRWDDQYLTNDHLRGRIDEVLQLKDGTYAPLDYKFAEWKDKVFRTYKLQLYCYALLIEQNFGGAVNAGYLVYTRSSNKVVKVDIGQKEKERVRAIVREIAQVVADNKYPKATKYPRQCVSCTYRNICER